MTDLTDIFIDYNLYYGATRLIWHSSGTVWECTTITQCRAKGFEIHSPAMSNPEFVSIPNGSPGSANWSLRPSSPAIDRAISLATYIFDINDVLRPIGPAWDIGAYEYFSPLLPPILRIIR